MSAGQRWPQRTNLWRREPASRICTGLSLTTLVVTPASAQGIYMGRDGRVHSSGIVQPPKQAPAPHSLMPESYRKAAESTFKQEAQRRADLEAQNQAYVPP